MRPNTRVAALSLVVLAACAKGDKTADTSARATDTGAAPAAASAAPAPAFTDANIAALLDELNVADSTFGNLASSKGTSADVKAFGVLMMRDHHAMRKAGQDLVAKIGVTPAPPDVDSLPMKTRKISDSLTVIAKGGAFDRAYLDDEIANHQSVLDFLSRASSATQNADMKDLLAKARPTVEMHLTRAQDIRGKLGTGTP